MFCQIGISDLAVVFLWKTKQLTDDTPASSDFRNQSKVAAKWSKWYSLPFLVRLLMPLAWKSFQIGQMVKTLISPVCSSGGTVKKVIHNEKIFFWVLRGLQMGFICFSGWKRMDETRDLLCSGKAMMKALMKGRGDIYSVKRDQKGTWWMRWVAVKSNWL